MRGKDTGRTETTQSMEGRKRYCWVSEKEKKQMERQAHRTSQAREFKSKMCRFFPSEQLPRIVHDTQTAQRRQHVKKREQAQIKDHQDRMLRGRELIEQRLKERLSRRNQAQLPTLEKLESMKKEMKDFERANRHPLLELRRKSLIKLENLMEKSQVREEAKTVRPHQKKSLGLPPFLKSHVWKRDQ